MADQEIQTSAPSGEVLAAEAKVDTKEIRDDNGRFKPGCTGNPAGRPAGSPNKITGSMRQAVYEAFNELGGKDWLVTVAKAGDVKAVMQLFGKLIPAQLEIDSDTTIPVLIVKTADDKPESPQEPPAQE